MNTLRVSRCAPLAAQAPSDLLLPETRIPDRTLNRQQEKKRHRPILSLRASLGDAASETHKGNATDCALTTHVRPPCWLFETLSASATDWCSLWIEGWFRQGVPDLSGEPVNHRQRRSGQYQPGCSSLRWRAAAAVLRWPQPEAPISRPPWCAGASRGAERARASPP